MAMSQEEKRLKQQERDERREDLRDYYICVEAFEEVLDEQFFGRIASLGYECIVGPVHDKDVYPEGHPQAGKPKKAHRHLLFMFRNKKYLETFYNELKQVFGFLAPEGVDEPDLTECSCIGIPRPQKLNKTKEGYVRYMMHLDNPDKVRYNDVPVGLNGADVFSLLYNSGDLMHQLEEIFSLIDMYGLRYPHNLVSFLSQENRRDYVDNGDHTYQSKKKFPLTDA